MSLTTTQEQELVAHVSGVAGASDYGAGTTVHVTAAAGASLQNAAQDTRQSAASGTNTVVTKDNTGLLTTAERAAIDGAVGADDAHPISQSNPVVANAMPVAVPTLAQATVPAGKTASQIIVTSEAMTNVPAGAINLVCPVLWDATPKIYVGKQGVDSTGLSSAAQYFNVEDVFGVAMFDASQTAIYVTNLHWGNAVTAFDPSSSARAVDKNGFLALVTGDQLWIELSTAIPANIAFCLRLNVKGRMSNLASTWNAGTYPNYPSPTVYRNVKQPFVSATAGDFQSLTVGTTGSNKLRITVLSSSGTTWARISAPNTRTTTGTDSGYSSLGFNETNGDVSWNLYGAFGGTVRSPTFTNETTAFSWSVARLDNTGGAALESTTTWGRRIWFFNKNIKQTVRAGNMHSLMYGTMNYGDGVTGDYTFAGSNGPLLNIEDDITVTTPWCFSTGNMNESRLVLGIADGDLNTANVGVPTMFLNRLSRNANAASAATDAYQFYPKVWNANSTATLLQLGAVGAGEDFVSLVEISSAMRYGLGSVYSNVMKSSLAKVAVHDSLFVDQYVIGQLGYIGGPHYSYTDILEPTALNKILFGVSLENYVMSPTITDKYTRASGFGTWASNSWPLRYNSTFSASAPTTVHGASILGYSVGSSGLGASGLFAHRDVWLLPASGAADDVTSFRVGPAATLSGNGGFELIHAQGAYDNYVMPHVVYGTSTAAKNRLWFGSGTYNPTNGAYTLNDQTAICMLGTGSISLANSLYFGRNDSSYGIDTTTPKYGSIVPWVNSNNDTYSHRSYCSYTLAGGYQTRSAYGGFIPTRNGIHVFGDNPGTSTPRKGARVEFGNTTPTAQYNVGTFFESRQNLMPGNDGTAYDQMLIFGVHNELETPGSDVEVVVFTSSAFQPFSTTRAVDLGSASRPFQYVYGAVVDPGKDLAVWTPSPNTAGQLKGLYSLDTARDSEEHLHEAVRFSRGFAEAPMHRKASSIAAVSSTIVIDNADTWEVMDKCWSTAYNAYFGILYFDTGANATQTMQVVYSFDGVLWHRDPGFGTYEFIWQSPPTNSGRMYPRAVSVHGIPVIVIIDRGTSTTAETYTFYAKNAGTWAVVYTGEAGIGGAVDSFSQTCVASNSGPKPNATVNAASWSLAMSIAEYWSVDGTAVTTLSANSQACVHSVVGWVATVNASTNTISFSSPYMIAQHEHHALSGSYALTVSDLGVVYGVFANGGKHSGQIGALYGFGCKNTSFTGMALQLLNGVTASSTTEMVQKSALVEATSFGVDVYNVYDQDRLLATLGAAWNNGDSVFSSSTFDAAMGVANSTQCGYVGGTGEHLGQCGLASNEEYAVGMHTPTTSSSLCYAVSTVMNGGGTPATSRSRFPVTHMVKMTVEFDSTGNTFNFKFGEASIQTIRSYMRGLLHFAWNRYTQEFQAAIMTKNFRWVKEPGIAQVAALTTAPPNVYRLEPSVDLWTASSGNSLLHHGFQRVSTNWISMFKACSGTLNYSYDSTVMYPAPGAVSGSVQPQSYDPIRGYTTVHVVMTSDPVSAALPKRTSAVLRLQ